MSELLDFGKYTPYIAAAYGASAIVIAAMIYQRWKKLSKARDLEQRNTSAHSREGGNPGGVKAGFPPSRE